MIPRRRPQGIRHGWARLGRARQVREMKSIEVVAAVIAHGSQVLCVQRGPSARADISGKWEFPGGKVEPDEDHRAALAREIAEELRVTVHVHHLLLTVEHAYSDIAIRLHAHLCTLDAEPASLVLTEHVAAQWLSPTDPAFAELDWAGADVPIVRVLQRGAATEHDDPETSPRA